MPLSTVDLESPPSEIVCSLERIFTDSHVTSAASTILRVLVERLKKDEVITPLRHIHISTEHRDQKNLYKTEAKKKAKILE